MYRSVDDSPSNLAMLSFSVPIADHEWRRLAAVIGRKVMT
jgi:hypothetical protein